MLVDLDSMVDGPPEVDLAEFLVDLALRDLPERRHARGRPALLSSYTAATGAEIDAALLSVCADAEFVNRCYRHLRRHTPGWQPDLEAELARHADVTSLLPELTAVSRGDLPRSGETHDRGFRVARGGTSLR